MKTKQIFYDFWESIIIIGERQLFLLVTTIQPLNLNLSIIKFAFSKLNIISNSKILQTIYLKFQQYYELI
jgi:hypothetical protein